MIWEVFQMHVAQRPMCSQGAEITCHRSRSPDLCWNMSSCLQVLHLAENDVADAVQELGSPGSGPLRKAALCPTPPPPPRRRLQTGLMGCSTDVSARHCLPDVLARAGPTKVKGEAAPNRPAQHPGVSVVRLPRRELGDSTKSTENVQFLAPSVCN